MVQRLQQIEDGRRSYAANAELLRKIAADDFLLVAHAPPLLYHNDLTASVRRFYWSEEIGYALWLRLYVENERARSQITCPPDEARPECGKK